MSNNAPAFPWFKVELLNVANDLTDVKSLEGEGAYFRTLRHLWLNGPQPIADIAKRCKSSFAEVEHVFSACSTDVEPLFSIRWLEDQRGKAETGREKWKKAGEASAAARRAKSKKKPARSSSKATDLNERSSNDEHTLNECSTDVEHSISTSTSISTQSSEKERAGKVLFVNSKYADHVLAAAELSDLKIDFAGYAAKIRNWSDAQDIRRTDRGWLATYRTFYAKDQERSGRTAPAHNTTPRQQDIDLNW